MKLKSMVPSQCAHFIARGEVCLQIPLLRIRNYGIMVVMQTIILANGPCHIGAINYSFIICDICFFFPWQKQITESWKMFQEHLLVHQPAFRHKMFLTQHLKCFYIKIIVIKLMKLDCWSYFIYMQVVWHCYFLTS